MSDDFNKQAQDRFRAIADEINLPSEDLELDALLYEWPLPEKASNDPYKDFVTLQRELSFDHQSQSYHDDQHLMIEGSIPSLLLNSIKPQKNRLPYFDLPICSQFPAPPPIPSSTTLVAKLPMMKDDYRTHNLIMSDSAIDTLKAIIIELKDGNTTVSVAEVAGSILDALIHDNDEGLILNPPNVAQIENVGISPTISDVQGQVSKHERTEQQTDNASAEVFILDNISESAERGLFRFRSSPSCSSTSANHVTHLAAIPMLPNYSSQNEAIENNNCQVVPSGTDCSPPRLSPLRLSSSHMRSVLKTSEFIIDENTNDGYMSKACSRLGTTDLNQVKQQSWSIAPQDLGAIEPTLPALSSRKGSNAVIRAVHTHGEAVALSYSDQDTATFDFQVHENSNVPSISTFSPQDRVAEFARLRGRYLARLASTHNKDSCDSTSTKPCHRQTLPPLPEFGENTTSHKYIISTRILQHRELVRLLNEVCRVEFVERDLDVYQPDVMIDERTCILYYVSRDDFISVPRIMSRLKRMVSYYETILIILQQSMPPANTLYTATSSFVTKVSVNWTNTTSQSARLIRSAGDFVESRLSINFDDLYVKVWKGRSEWLLSEETQQERFLVALRIFNPYSAQIVLSKMSLRQCLSASYDELVELIGKWIPPQLLEEFARFCLLGDM
ncbi:hypothetical protein SeMB42_g05503 [Synchytrium endobioticum]|uniref:Uncharacterized protein n=1 Tax=Synchytrium endobioticum TaxID=286115 RepID=A0A507CR40_9FUNG|nr:hypothetical protein SeMB42_g05503 [Synchytrium endobioticum]